MRKVYRHWVLPIKPKTRPNNRILFISGANVVTIYFAFVVVRFTFNLGAVRVFQKVFKMRRRRETKKK